MLLRHVSLCGMRSRRRKVDEKGDLVDFVLKKVYTFQKSKEINTDYGVDTIERYVIMLLTQVYIEM